MNYLRFWLTFFKNQIHIWTRQWKGISWSISNYFLEERNAILCIFPYNYKNRNKSEDKIHRKDLVFPLAKPKPSPSKTFPLHKKLFRFFCLSKFFILFSFIVYLYSKRKSWYHENIFLKIKFANFCLLIYSMGSYKVNCKVIMTISSEAF